MTAGWRGRAWRLAVVSGVIAGCSGATDGRWVGPVTPETTGCSASRGVLVARSGDFTFAPSEGVMVVRGSISAAGDLHGLYRTEGQTHLPFEVRFDGRLVDGSIQGLLQEPGCRARVALHPG